MSFHINTCSLQYCISVPTPTHLPILMVHKDIPGAVVLQVGDLQTVRGADFSRLESSVHTVDLHYRFGLSGLQEVTFSNHN